MSIEKAPQPLDEIVIKGKLEEAGELSAHGTALVLLQSVREYLTNTYGPEKSMSSLEGLSIIGNRLTSLVDNIIEDPDMASQVKKEIGDTVVVIDALFPAKAPKTN